MKPCYCLCAVSAVAGFQLGSQPPHPRLMLTDKRVSDVLAMMETDGYYRKIVSGLRLQTDEVVSAPPALSSSAGWSSEYRLNLLAAAGLYRLTKNATYSQWVTDGLLTMAGLSDWDPSNYLTTADIAMTTALGYDWVYEALTSEQRQTIEAAIESKAFVPALDPTAQTSWRMHTNNWAQVTGAGLVIAALAIGDVNGTHASAVMNFSVSQMTVSLEQYAPDGGWIEGYSYGAYANIFLTLGLRALETATNSTLGLTCLAGINKVGSWLTHGAGNTAAGFSWGDGAAAVDGNLLWSIGYWAQKYGRPEWLQGLLSRFNGTAQLATFQSLLFYSSELASASGVLSSMPRHHEAGNVAGMTYRSSWTDQRGWFFGLMGGFNGRSHGHLDAGSFVIDYKGQRWAELLGSDNYSLPSYFSAKGRTKYYRCRTEGANTLTISNSTQVPLHFGNQILSSNNSLLWAGSFDSDSRFGVANLTEAYADVTSSVLRGVALLNNTQMLIRDEVRAAHAVDIAAHWHTTASVHIQSDNRSATLQHGGVAMTMTVLSPADAYLQLVDTNPCDAYSPCAENHNAGVYNVAVRLSNRTAQATVSVVFSEQGVPAVPFDLSLSQWRDACQQDCWTGPNVNDPYWLRHSEKYF